MTTDTYLRQSSGDVIKTERRDRVDRLDVAVVDEFELLHEMSAELNVGIAVSSAIGEHNRINTRTIRFTHDLRSEFGVARGEDAASWDAVVRFEEPSFLFYAH